MKILTAKQTQEADKFTIKNEPIASIDLMERASKTCFEWIINKFDVHTPFVFFCGIGNNGGDGLAIARMLKKANFDVVVYVVNFSKKHTTDFDKNIQRLQNIGINHIEIKDNSYLITIDEKTILIDAIFGSGLSRPIDGFVAELVHFINNLNHQVIAIDMPSGLFAESNIQNNPKNIIHATYTLTFQQPKLSLLFPQHHQFVGSFFVLPIGLSSDILEKLDSNYFYVTQQFVQPLILKRSKFQHKGNFGHALLMSGSEGKSGAAVLAAKACLRTGVGLLTVHAPKITSSVLQITVPEAMCSIDTNEQMITSFPKLQNYNAIGIGPGIGTQSTTAKMFKLLIQNVTKPMVIDADALNILSENKTWISFLPPNSILTPHHREFERLVGKWHNDEERLEIQISFSVKNNLILVFKGANTSITMPDGKVYFNSTGNPGMATAGSGDVLTGILLSLLSQGYSPQKAAIIGVFLHGFAGDEAANHIGQEALLSSDIVDYISTFYSTFASM